MGIRGQRFDTLKEMKCSITAGLNIIPKEAFHVCFQAWQNPWSRERERESERVCVCVCARARALISPCILISSCILLLRHEHTLSYHTIYFWTNLLMYTKTNVLDSVSILSGVLGSSSWHIPKQCWNVVVVIHRVSDHSEHEIYFKCLMNAKYVSSSWSFTKNPHWW